MYIDIELGLGGGSGVGSIGVSSGAYNPLVITYAGGTPANASYMLLVKADGDEIATTGAYVAGTGIAMSGISYASSILQADDETVYLVDATFRYIDVYDTDDVKLIRFDLETDQTLSDDLLTVIWPTIGVSFIPAVFGNQSVNKSETSTIIITPTLYAALAADLTYTVTFSGGHSDVEDYGVGKHFDLVSAGATITNTVYNTTTVSGTVTAGNTTGTPITMTIVNNSRLEKDRAITISSPMFGAPKTVTIVDTRLSAANYFDVTDVAYAGGAKGDGVTDDTAAIAAALAAANSAVGANSTSDQAIVYFPAGTYKVSGHLAHLAGVHLVGENKDNTTIIRMGLADLIADGKITDGGDEPEGTWANTTKNPNEIGAYVISCTAFTHAASDSALTGVQNMTLDGNLAECPYGADNVYFPTSAYTLWESSPFLQFYAAIGSTGQVKYLVENVIMTGSPATGIGIYSRSDSSLYNVTFDENLKLKGAISVNGVEIDCLLRNCTFSGDANPSGIDVEQDASGRIALAIYDTTVNGTLDLGFDNGGASGGSSLILSNVTHEYNANAADTFVFSGYDVTLTASDCVFLGGRFGLSGNTFTTRGAVAVTDCDFYSVDKGSGTFWACPPIKAPDRTYPINYTFTRCSFRAHTSIGAQAFNGIYCYLYDGDNSQEVIFEECSFINTANAIANWGETASSSNGGKFTVNNCVFSGVTYPLYLHGGNGGSADCRLDIVFTGADTDFGNAPNLLYLYRADATNGPVIHTDFTGLIIPKAAASIGSNDGIAGIPVENCAAYPNGTICLTQAGVTNTDDPTAAQDGFLNMKYKTTEGIGDRKCTTAHHNGSAVWGAPS